MALAWSADCLTVTARLAVAMPGANATLALESALVTVPPAMGVTAPMPGLAAGVAVRLSVAAPPVVHSW